MSEAVCLTSQDAALWHEKAAFLEFVESEMPACNAEEGNVCCGWWWRPSHESQEADGRNVLRCRTWPKRHDGLDGGGFETHAALAHMRKNKEKAVRKRVTGLRRVVKVSLLSLWSLASLTPVRTSDPRLRGYGTATLTQAAASVPCVQHNTNTYTNTAAGPSSSSSSLVCFEHKHSNQTECTWILRLNGSWPHAQIWKYEHNLAATRQIFSGYSLNSKMQTRYSKLSGKQN